MTSVTLQ